MSESLQVGINKLSLKAGDVLVVTISKDICLTSEMADQLKEQFTNLFSNKVVIVQGVSFSVFRNGTEVMPEPAGEVDSPISVSIPTRPADATH